MGLFRRKNTTSTATPPAALPAKRFTLVLPKQESTFAPENVWSNADQDPTPKDKQTWGTGTWWTFWLSAVADPASWQTGASIIPLGLSWRDAIGVVVLGNCVIGLVIILNGAIGSRLRVPFPVAARASFGYYFSLFAIISRVVLAWFWFGIETYNGGSAMSQLLRAMWPSYANIPNRLPASAGFTTMDMCSYLLFSLVQLPFFFISTNRLRYFFVGKCFIVPAVALGMMGYLVRKAGGGGPILAQEATISGQAYSKAWLLSFAAILGNWAPLACNSPDFTRYAVSDRAQWLQFFAIPVCGLFITVCGIIGASASMIVYGGEALWSPFDILALWGNRTAVWFCAFGWIVGSIGSNITANSLSAGNDLASMFPRYFNINRGQLFSALIGGWAMAPWQILSSGESFLTFMSAYPVIMGPIAAIITADFWLVNKGAYDIPALYDPRGIYRFTGGVNWRAALTLLLTIPPNLPGLINAITPSIYVGNISWYYAPGFITGYVPGLVVYTVLCKFWPNKATIIPHVIYGDERDEEWVSSSSPNAESSSVTKVALDADADVEPVGVKLEV